jgi:hypothetical protein
MGLSRDLTTERTENTEKTLQKSLWTLCSRWQRISVRDISSRIFVCFETLNQREIL